MPFVEYVLLAILGSAPIAPGTPGNVSLRTYDAESVAQPAGSAPTAASSRADEASNSNKKSTTDNRNGKKAEKSGKKSTGTNTPPPK